MKPARFNPFEEPSPLLNGDEFVPTEPVPRTNPVAALVESRSRGIIVVGRDESACQAGASIIPQLGVWAGGTEPSVQIIVLNTCPLEPYENFKRNIAREFEMLAMAFGQDLVLVNFYKNGVADQALEISREVAR